MLLVFLFTEDYVHRDVPKTATSIVEGASKEHQRVVMQFLCAGCETTRYLSQNGCRLRSAVLSQRRMYERCNLFRGGRINVADEPRPEQANIANHGREHCEGNEMIRRNRRVPLDAIANESGGKP